MIVWSAIALFGLVLTGSIRLYNLAACVSGNSRGESGMGIDFLVAFFATALFVAERLS